MRLTPARRRVYAISALVLGLIAGLLLSEAALRLYLAYRMRGSLEDLRRQVPSDPHAEVPYGDLIYATGDNDIIYRLKPGAVGIFQGKLVRINGWGMRDTELTEKGPNDKRILVLGDSNSFGWGVERGENWVERIEDCLNRMAPPGTHVDVLNAALPGYNAHMQVSRFHADAEALQPDAVLIQYCNNDAVLPNFIIKENYLGNWRRSYLFEALTGHVRETKLALREQVQKSEDGPFSFEWMDPADSPPHYRHHLGPDALCRAYSRLRDTCARRKLPLGVVLPSERVFPDQPETAHNPNYDRARGYIEQLNMKVLDTFPTTQRFAVAHHLDSAAFAVGPPWDYHPNPLRHILMARALLPQCAEMLWPGKVDSTRLQAQLDRLDQMALREIAQPMRSAINAARR